MKTVKNLKKVVAMMLAVATLVTGMTFTSETKAQAFWYDKPVQFMGMDDCWATAYIHVENPYGVYHYCCYSLTLSLIELFKLSSFDPKSCHFMVLIYYCKPKYIGLQ